MSLRCFHSDATHLDSSRGFGLIELLVCISIIIIVMAVVIARHSAFNSAVLLRNQAYEIALSLREIQLNAVSAIGFNNGEFRTVLGAHFDTSRDDTYRTFRDTDSDHYYDGLNEEFGLQNMIDRRFEIRAIRTVDSGGEAPLVGGDVSIVFERPNYDARFFSGSDAEINVSSIEIDIGVRGQAGQSGDTPRTIEITATGQIAVVQ